MKKPFLAIAALSLAGCATIIGSTTQPVTIKTEPEGAQISVSNRAGEKIHSGSTPVTVTLNRGAGYFKAETYTVRIAKEGYEPREVVLEGHVNGWYFGNIIFGGVILGMLIVDPLSGAMFTLSPDKVDEALQKTGVTGSKDDGSLTVVLIENVPEEVLRTARRVN
ncbi:PEGA domain-containing protein [Azoarcus olearius]|uniref:Conserved hypothetical membrane protein n=1 Tax=Azoarcus sp. (strain BH72) TaxID=418699 RepID=A1K2A1_AZOSB|nr:PEGA domain-containing protein [Azoarcus olearius]CAL92956.1 conserved hypothetical membrane protein [Azoarcus olearius]